MENNEKHHIVPYKTYIYILLALVAFTLLSVAVTRIELGSLTVGAALLFAGIKSILVLSYFMHLKFDQKVFAIMVTLVLLVFILVVVITMLDYSFR